MNIQPSYKEYTVKYYSAIVYKVDKSEFIVDKQFKPTQQIQIGTYGVLVGAEDTQSEIPTKVVITKIEKAFEQSLQGKRLLRELKLLRLLKHENIVNLLSLQLPKSREYLQDIYMITVPLDSDLRKVLERDHPKLSNDHFRLFLQQILRALKFMHSANVLHRDLKSKNLLLSKEHGILKVCDFGLSKSLLQEINNERYFNQAPEQLFGVKQQTSAIDIWAVGCIFVEMLTGKHLWKGQTAVQQLNLIFETFGKPLEQETQTFEEPQDRLYDLINEIAKMPKIQWGKIVKSVSKDGINLIERMLELDYTKRISASDALQHPYLADIHVSYDEPTRQPIFDGELEFERYDLSPDQLKDLLYEEILLYHYPDFADQYFNNIENNQSVISHIIGKNTKIIETEEEEQL